ncbi:hypothetical protein [Streptomyces sp. NPDC059466]|uniref:hypothetical protein n=1 Tax=unclassified Streptomyces TaxID=2593676 RepID=UPI0036AF4C9E
MPPPLVGRGRQATPGTRSATKAPRSRTRQHQKFPRDIRGRRLTEGMLNTTNDIQPSGEYL